MTACGIEKRRNRANREMEVFEYGKFVHIRDLEGNKITLWGANDQEFAQMTANAVTK
jgi:hypothetical protein